MEKFPNTPNSSENTTPSPIENPYFFDDTNDKRVRGETESMPEITKRSLEKVGKLRGSREYLEYAQSMENLLSRKMENNLDKALGDFCKYKLRRDDGSLTSLVVLQNEVTSILSGLEESDRMRFAAESKKAVRGWLESNPQYKGFEDKVITSFDGSLAACLYMDKRKDQYGERVEFYSDAFLDERRSIDLVEVVRYGRDSVELRLVQNKSSLSRDSESREESVDIAIGNHKKWVEEELFGINDVRENFMRALAAERNSEHHENLKELLVDTYADVTVDILELRNSEKEDSDTKTLDEFFESAGVSQLSKYALLFAFYEESGRDTSRLEDEIAHFLKEESGENIISGLNVSKIESIFAVDDEEVSFYPIYGRRDDRDLFLGTEASN